MSSVAQTKVAASASSERDMVVRSLVLGDGRLFRQTVTEMTGIWLAVAVVRDRFPPIEKVMRDVG